MADSNRVSLRAIAERTGLTRMAVSLALRGKAGVSEETRQKVLKVAGELGYSPDPEIAKLMAQLRARTAQETRSSLALLTSGRSPTEWKDYTTERKYVEGVYERAKAYGYHITEFWMNEPGMTEKRISNIIWNRGIEGVIIAPLQGNLSGRKDRSIHLDFSLFSAVEISETVEWPNLDRAIHDQYTSMLILLDELGQLNYTRIGLVLEEALDLRVNRKWTAAYLQHRQKAGARSMPPPLILKARQQDAFNKWFDRYRPDAVISVDRFGLGFLEQRGIAIPDEVGYASLDLDGLSTTHPDFSGIDQNSSMVGACAVDLVVAAIQRGYRGIPDHPVRTQTDGTWIAGSSTRSTGVATRVSA